MTWRLAVRDEPTDTDREAILAPLRAYNRAQAGDARVRPVAIVVEDDAGAVAGGLWGRVGYEWMFIELLVVPEAARGAGLGRQLMAQAEAMARAESARINTVIATAQAQLATARTQAREGHPEDAIATLDAALASLPSNPLTQKTIAGIQADSSLSVQEKANSAQKAIDTANNLTQTTIAGIQKSTTLTAEDKQTAEQTLLAGLNNTNAQTVQQMVNDGNLANIKANGVINTQVTQMTDDNKTLLQTSQGAQTLYNTSLQQMSTIIQNPNLDEAGKTQALQDAAVELNDGLGAMSVLAGIAPVLQSTLSFGSDGAWADAGTQNVTRLPFASAPLTISAATRLFPLPVGLCTTGRR
jgi:GNAT superfamily N-acetyltransferase